jgi:hypothetical protein
VAAYPHLEVGMAETVLGATAKGSATMTDWARVARLRKETEQAIIRAEEATKRREEAVRQTK